MRVRVTGATGFIGGHPVPALREAGHEVSVLVRDPDRYKAPEGVAVHGGDLLKSGSFEAAMERCKAVYYLVHFRTPAQPVAIADVVHYLVGVLDVPETRGETYEIGGPEGESEDEKGTTVAADEPGSGAATDTEGRTGTAADDVGETEHPEMD
jgi:uncharacterized protein YbjT (DUF2867 family)